MVTSIQCQECGIGRCRPVTTPYLLPIGKHMLVMPDSPAYVCDICGNRFFDDEFLNGVHYLLEQAAEESRRRTRRRQAPHRDPAVLPQARRSR
ncbi:MAG: YgiT-type zinc finger protein [Candidatus Promineofilum sp.]|nr:YgiT-type zinc finger protein [Promineifilum sp.]